MDQMKVTTVIHLVLDPLKKIALTVFKLLRAQLVYVLMDIPLIQICIVMTLMNARHEMEVVIMLALTLQAHFHADATMDISWMTMENANSLILINIQIWNLSWLLIMKQM